MQYEIYIDRIWMINFLMNYNILTIVNLYTFETCGKKRRVTAAAFGATTGLLTLLPIPGGAICRGAIAVISLGGMLYACFRPATKEAFFHIALRSMLCAFLLGGGVLCISRAFGAAGIHLPATWLVLIPGGITTFVQIVFLKERHLLDNECTAVLCKEGKRMEVVAILDSGNSLYDPYTGQPICVLSRAAYEPLAEEGESFRLVPYKSVGESNGLLEVVTIPGIELKIRGIRKTLRNVAVGIPSGYSCNREQKCVDFIVHPALLQENGGRYRDDT